MTITWQYHGNNIAITSHRNNCNIMVITWQQHGKDIAITWQHMAIAWQTHGKHKCCCMCCFSGTTITHSASKRGCDSPAMNHMRCKRGGDSPVMNHMRCQHVRWRLPCIATKAIIMPCSCPAAQQGHDCFCWAKGRKAPLDKPSCCNFRRRTKKSCRHGWVISWSVTLHCNMGPRSIFQLRAQGRKSCLTP
jgi:hypothetical protein